MLWRRACQARLLYPTLSTKPPSPAPHARRSNMDATATAAVATTTTGGASASTAAKQVSGQEKNVPAAGALFDLISEHTATVLGPKGNKVFYNKVQNVNRDLSVLVLNVFAKQLAVENAERVAKRRMTGGRKLVPTWETWGPAPAVVSTNADADVAQQETEEEGKPAAKKAKTGKEEGNFSTSASAENLEEQEVEGDEEDAVAPVSDKHDGLVILEALAASGLRSIRYAREITDGVGVDCIFSNDLESHAVEAIRRNVLYNGIDVNTKIIPCCYDAADLMHRNAFNRTKISNAQKASEAEKKEASSSSTSTTDASKSENGQTEPRTFQPGHGFDVIDLDPYGSPSKFLDSAVRAIRDGGLLCVTATDEAGIIGSETTPCYTRYNVQSVKGDYNHEFAIRTILSAIEREAIKYNRHIVPLLSVHIDFYIRVFVRVYTSKNLAKYAPTRLGYVFQSVAGSSFHVLPVAQATGTKVTAVRFDTDIGSKCADTNSGWEIGGPIWAAPIYNPAFVQACLDRFETPAKRGKAGGGSQRKKEKDTMDDLYVADILPVASTNLPAAKVEKPFVFDPTQLPFSSRVYGLILSISQELPDIPLHYDISSLCRFIHCETPPHEQLFAALDNLGYRYSQVHYSPQGFKTDAPPNVVWDIIRCWEKKHPVKDSRSEDKMVKDFLAKEPSINANFTPSKELRIKMKNQKTAPRFMPNPEANWGPKSRAEGSEPGQTHKRKRGERKE